MPAPPVIDPTLDFPDMPRFQYLATDSDGLEVRAELEAANPVEAAEQLRQMGLFPLRIEQLPEPLVPQVAASPPTGGLFGGLVHELRTAAEELQRRAAEEHRQRGPGRKPAQRPIVCGWCETVVPPEPVLTNCPNCGGTLPLPPGPDRGPEPPPTPRELPAKFIRRIRYYSAEFLIGAIFLALGLLLAIPTFGLMLLFALIGGGMLAHHWKGANNRIEALRRGVPTEGEITFSGRDKTTTVNGKHPYMVEYRYQVEGRTHEGSKKSFNAGLSDHYPGEPIWVVYVPEAPHKSAVWPPLA